jgi:hypothetical protein
LPELPPPALANLKLNCMLDTEMPPGRELEKVYSRYRFVPEAIAVEGVWMRPSAYESGSELFASAPLLASRRSHAEATRGPGKIRFEVTDIGPPVTAELKPANASEAAIQAATAVPAKIAARLGRPEGR